MFLDLTQEISKEMLDIPTAEKIMAILKRKNIDMKNYINRKIGCFQETLLHYFARIDHIHLPKEKGEFLLQVGADINSIDRFCNTPLHKAVTSSNDEILKLLLNNSAYVNSENKHKNTPLYNAVLKNIEICRILLNHGADPNIMTAQNETPLSRAAIFGSTEIFKLLLQHGGDVTSTGSLNGKRVIDLAKSLEDKSIYNLCLENLKNSTG